MREREIHEMHPEKWHIDAQLLFISKHIINALKIFLKDYKFIVL